MNGQKPINKKTTHDHFVKGLKNAGIDREDRVIVIYSFRHTFNTKMRQLLSEQTLRYFVGHKTERLTDRYDGSTALDRLRAFLPEQGKIDDAWG